MAAHGGSVSHGGAWPTPDTGGERINRSASDGASERPTIALAAKLWISPTAKEGRRPESEGDLMLPSAAAQWPTPASRDYRTPNSEASQASRNHTGGEQLPNFVEHHFSRPVLSTLDGREFSTTARTLPRRLNPAFGCWLMGWPIWWTNPALTSCARSEMESYRCRLQWHLSSLCGALPLELEEE
ncbi:hypothetical protein [Paracidovorax wautersii]|uniref:hypothetical protein n=1 Tax=Paracidovorax wautersii TaxID=1177982 RepID=UPI0031DB1C39